MALGDTQLAGKCRINEAYNYIWMGQYIEARRIIRTQVYDAEQGSTRTEFESTYFAREASVRAFKLLPCVTLCFARNVFAFSMDVGAGDHWARAGCRVASIRRTSQATMTLRFLRTEESNSSNESDSPRTPRTLLRCLAPLY